jgi:hypothetical protein
VVVLPCIPAGMFMGVVVLPCIPAGMLTGVTPPIAPGVLEVPEATALGLPVPPADEAPGGLCMLEFEHAIKIGVAKNQVVRARLLILSIRLSMKCACRKLSTSAARGRA